MEAALLLLLGLAVAAASTNSADWYTKYSAVPSTGVQEAVVVPTAAPATKKAALPTKAIPVADPSALRKEDWGKNLRTMGSSLVLQRIAAHIVFNLVIASLVWGLRSVGVISSAFPGAPWLIFLANSAGYCSVGPSSASSVPSLAASASGRGTPPSAYGVCPSKSTSTRHVATAG